MVRMGTKNIKHKIWKKSGKRIIVRHEITIRKASWSHQVVRGVCGNNPILVELSSKY